MNEIAWALAMFAGLATLLHVISALLLVYRTHRGSGHPSVTEADTPSLPPISLLRPVRGLDPYDELTLRSSFDRSRS